MVGNEKGGEERGRPRGIKGAILNMIDNFMLLLFRFTYALSYVLHARILRLFFELIGTFIFLARPRMRRDLCRKIKDGLPGIKSEYEVKRIARQACASMILPVFDGIIFARYRDKIMRSLKIVGWENFEEADARGNGVLVMATHVGAAPLLLHAVMAHLGKPYTPIAWHPKNLPVPRYANAMLEFAKSLGCDPEDPVIFAGPGFDAIGAAREVLKKGKRIGMTIDIPGKCVVPFFGRPAALADGIAHFSIDSKAPIVPVALYRDGWKPRLMMRVSKPICPEITGNRKEDIRKIMLRCSREAELQIMRSPGQWMCWFGLWKWWEAAEEIISAQKIGKK